MNRAVPPLLSWALVVLGALVLVPVAGVLAMAVWEGRMPSAQLGPAGELPLWLVLWGVLLAAFLALLVVWILKAFAVWMAGRDHARASRERPPHLRRF